MSEHGYKIGEFAQLMGISPDALRYFEDRGVLVPQRDPVNGYRYYGIECSPKLTLFRLLRACGFTYEQTLEPSNSIGMSGFNDRLDHRLGGVDRLIARLRCEREALEHYRALSQRILDQPDFLSIETVDRTFYVYFQFYNNLAINDRERQPVIRALTAALPISFFGVLPDCASVFQEAPEDTDRYGMLIDERHIPLMDEPDLFTHPDRIVHLDAVCRFVCSVGYDGPWPPRFLQVRRQLLSRGYEVTGDPVIRILPEYIQSTTFCMEVYLPIQARPQHKIDKEDLK